MSEQNNTWTFKAEDIFEDIPDDPKNVNMNIPDEIMQKMGWKEGDTIRVLWGDQGTITIEKVEKENSGKEKQTTE
jgi:hypothetical protein